MLRKILVCSAVLLGFVISPVQAVPLSVFVDDTSPPDYITFKTVGTTPITMSVFKPEGWKATDKHPVMVLVHGGAWVAGDDKVFLPHARYFASRGFLAVSINYRLVTADGPSVGDCLADCKSAIRYIRANADKLGINPDQVAAMGDSAGGHLVAALACCSGFDDPADDLKISAVPNAVIPCNPIMDFKEGTWDKFIIRGDLLKPHAKVTPDDLKLTPDQDKLAQALSPTDCIKPGQPPMLLMHGTDDHVVNPDQARTFAAAYTKAGNRCDLFMVPDQGHAFVLVKYRAPEDVVVDCIRRADAFIASLGWYNSAPTLEVSNPPVWTPKPKPTPKITPTPTPASPAATTAVTSSPLPVGPTDSPQVAALKKQLNANGITINYKDMSNSMGGPPFASATPSASSPSISPTATPVPTLASAPTLSPTPNPTPALPTYELPKNATSLDAEWQFALPIPGTDKQHPSMAYMWIPPKCKYVRGVIIAQQTILEDKVLQDPIIRQAATDEDLAIILTVGGFGYFMYDKEPELPNRFQDLMEALAKESGYSEIAQAPFISLGHSGNGIFAWHIAYWNPARTIGIIGLHCVTSDPVPGYPKASVDGVPALGISGEYESWGNPEVPLDSHWRWLRACMLNYRSRNAAALMTEVVDPGGTHFSCNAPLTSYMALFIRKACEYRLPAAKEVTPGQLPQLKEIPLHAGWLTDCNVLSPHPKNEPAPYDAYTGDWGLAFWQFDKDFAMASNNFRVDSRGKRDERITFVDDGKPVPATWLEEVKFKPIDDGLTFKVSADFLGETPAGVADSGKPLGHTDQGNFTFSLIGGWRGGGQQLGPDTFRIHPGHLGFTDNLMILAAHEGDCDYAYAEQPMQVKYPRQNKEGLAQTITFPKPDDVPNDASEITLKATASSGLPVEYYVVRGPGIVTGNVLHLSPAPARTPLPMKVTVVAYQWGRSLDQLVQSASPIEQTFLITDKN